MAAPAQPGQVPQLRQMIPTPHQKRVPWRGPLVVLADPGELVEVRGVHPDGRALTGISGSHGRWTSTGPLVPDAVYELTGAVRDASGAVHPWSLTARTR